MRMSEQYTYGTSVVLTVSTVSVGLDTTTLAPTAGRLAGRKLEKIRFVAVGPLYFESYGTATTSSYPMAAAEYLEVGGYDNLVNMRWIRNTNDTTVKLIPMYR